MIFLSTLELECVKLDEDGLSSAYHPTQPKSPDCAFNLEIEVLKA